ncbi:DUF4240 domain-containing protein [Brevundimonas sp. Root1279]|uniref:DUF4240 domain-containing protein n=1 Tax=Brevundimonas sp. Root1279 TaxID=1736443 RepID=UPI0006F1F24C|nr:DUF4240 domain-containing protein [Brevundimonas sp. Root1279]KQW81918.1 hypothetical protein ASC65_11575 [Brevundimonas sp. Root1279]
MSDAVFWAIVDRSAARADDPDAQLEALRTELEALDAESVAGFIRAFEGQMDRAYSWELWGAGYVAYGGMSDDGFVYFRRWLISRGRADFERLLASPDDLPLLVPTDAEGLEFEEFAYVAVDLWSEKTGDQDPPFGLAADGLGTEPRGRPFQEDPAALAQRYPKTWARFGERPLG